MIRVLVCGGRNFKDSRKLAAVLDQLHVTDGISWLVNGGATGADILSSRWARARSIAYSEVLADWDDISHPDAVIKTRRDGTRYDATAGPRRNQKMLDLYRDRLDLVIAFLK